VSSDRLSLSDDNEELSVAVCPAGRTTGEVAAEDMSGPADDFESDEDCPVEGAVVTSDPDVPVFLLSWAREPGPRRVLAAIRDRLEKGQLGVRSQVAVDLSPAERREVGRLLDARWAGSGGAVRVRELRAGITGHGTTLEDLLVAVGGPLRDRPAERRERAAARDADRADGVATLVALLGVAIPEERRSQVEEALVRWVVRDHPGRARSGADARRGLLVEERTRPEGVADSSVAQHVAAVSQIVTALLDRVSDPSPLARVPALGQTEAGSGFVGRESVLVRHVGAELPPVGHVLETAPVVDDGESGGQLSTDVAAPLRLAVIAATLTGDAHALDRSRVLGRAVARFLALRAAFASGHWDVDGDPIATADQWRDAWGNAGVACDAVSARVLVLNLPLAGTAPAVGICAAARGEPVWLSLRSLAGDVSIAQPADVYVCENPTVVEAAADRLGARSRPLVCTYGRPDAAALALLRALGRSARLFLHADGDAAGWSIVDGLLAELPGAVRWRMPHGLTAYEEEVLAGLLADLAIPP